MKQISEKTLKSAYQALEFQRQTIEKIGYYSPEVRDAVDKAQDRIDTAMDEILKLFHMVKR